MNITNEIKRLLKIIMDNIHNRRRVILGLSCIVVFITTYMLILPAFTLEKTEAAEQGGIDVPQAEETIAEEESSEEAAETESPAESEEQNIQEEVTEEITVVEPEAAAEEETETSEGDPQASTEEKTVKEEIAEEPNENSDSETDKAEEKTDEVTDQEPDVENQAGSDTAVNNEDGQEEATETDPLVFEGEGYTVSVADKDHILPANTEIRVEEIDQKLDEEAYKQYVSDSIQAVNEDETTPRASDLKFARFYDITLVADGKEITTPEDAVSVRIEYDKELSKDMNVEDPEKIHVIHFAEDKKTGEIEPEVLDSKTVEVNTDKKDNLTDAAFETDSFSVYAVVYTVDFHWDVDGKKFDFSIPGGGFVSLKQLVEELSIGVSDSEADKNAEPVTAKSFVAEVESVKFSSPELVWVGKANEAVTVGNLKEANGLGVEYSADLTKEQIGKINAQTVEAGDWALIGMHPFTSEETLTVTMRDCEQFTVKVTDAQISTHVIAADGKDFVITVTYGDDAKIPEGARLEADEILSGTEEYEKYVSQALKAVSEEKKPDNSGDKSESEAPEDTEGQFVEETEELGIAFARFFDIRIMDGDKKIEPSAPVNVTVTYTEPIETLEEGNICAVHFAEDGVEVIEASSDEEKKEVAFTQDSFSVTGTVVTTNNNWPSSNGKYLMYVESGGSYYAVAHDGTLTPVTIDNGKITIGVNKTVIDADYLWNYEAQRDSYGRDIYFVYYNNGSADIYLDPRNDNGMNANPQSWSMPTLGRGNGGLINSTTYGSTGLYIGANENSITGRQPRSNAVPVQFATMPLTLTVHFVDREGNPLDGVSYNGSNDQLVTRNSDGTYSIPYYWDGQSGSVSFKSDFEKDGYTYANTHLAGTRNGTFLTYNGLVIDEVIREENNNLYFYTDRADNRKYGNLGRYSFRSNLSVPQNYTGNGTDSTLSGSSGMTLYNSTDTDKDVYVILDPIPDASSAGGQSGGVDVKDPVFKKKLVSNGDGTYTLSLSVTGAAKNTESNPKANVVFVVDTSSSMVNNNTENNVTRLEDTRIEVEKFAKQLLTSNTLPGRDSDTIELSMVSFDGGVVSNGTWYTTYDGNSGFSSQVNRLTTQNMHTGTDWEDGLKKALDLAKSKLSENEATYVVFFTDGEPSQYTSFNGPGENGGRTRGYRYWYSYFLSREAAKDEARAIVNSGIELYAIYAYNADETTYNNHGVEEGGSQFLHNLVKYAHNTTAPMNGTAFFPAQNTSDLNKAFSSILNRINEYVGITDVKVNDNITSLTSVGITTGDQEDTGFKYTRSGGKYGTTEQTWDEAPSATYDANGVHWDLGNTLLEEGVTYKVSFVVWPSQEAYDWVADLNNGVRTWEDLEAAHLQDHFLRVEDSTTPSGYRYEVATNPPSKDSEGHIINNLIEYIKTHKETIGNLPPGVSLNVPVEETDPVTGTKTTTTYTQNPDGTFTKTVVTEARKAFGPPDLNMDLSDTKIKVQKKWTADRLSELVAFLFNTSNGELREDKRNIDFVIRQGLAVAPYTESDYKTVTLGFQRFEEVDGKQVPVFDWADEPQEITVKEITYSIGTIWEEPLDIAVGLMLTPDKAVEHGIDLTDPKYVPVYESEDSTEVLYYVLEKGHDYEISEPNLDYRFDFRTDKYHPMLVNKVLRDAKITYKNKGGREIGILESITPEGQRLSVLTGENVLRGELTIQKDVLDLEGNPDSSEQAKSQLFPMTVTLTNDNPVFYNGDSADEHHVPWIGVQHGNSDHIYYYHKFLEDGTIEYADEGDACVNGDYAQGLKDGYYGHAMTESEDNKSATEKIYLTAEDKWVITNIPPGTTYQITEDTVRGYQFVSAEELNNTPQKIVTDSPTIIGTVPPAQVTDVLYTNQKVIVPIDVVIKKTDDLENSTNYLEGAVFKLLYREDSSGTFTNVSNEVVPELDSESKFVVPEDGIKLTGLVDGQYQLQEISPPTGYVIINSEPVTFTVSEGAITSTEGIISDVRYTAATETSDAEFIISNPSAAALPEAGGIGTTIFYIFGSILVLVGGIYFIARRRAAL